MRNELGILYSEIKHKVGGVFADPKDPTKLWWEDCASSMEEAQLLDAAFKDAIYTRIIRQIQIGARQGIQTNWDIERADQKLCEVCSEWRKDLRVSQVTEIMDSAVKDVYESVFPVKSHVQQR